MLYLISGILLLVTFLLALPLLSDITSLIKASLRARESTQTAVPIPKLAFLISAYNEEGIVGEAIRSVQDMEYPREFISIYVIADNCTDQTEQVARESGAMCLVRNEPKRPGKQYAIAWALERIPFRDHDAIVIVDADSVVATDFAKGLAMVAPLRQKAVQSYNGVSNPSENSLTRLAALLSAVYYEFMYPLRQRAGLNVPLTGSGMCVGSALLERYGWTASAISENIEIYLQLSLEGERVECASRARVFSQEARSLKQSWSQRLRWRGGRLAVFRETLEPLLRSRRLGTHAKLDLAGELLLPGPAAQLGLLAFALTVLLLTTPPGWIPIGALLAAAMGRWFVYGFLALSRASNPLRTLAAVGYLPIYIVWRLGAEAAALTWSGQDRPWIRTRRHTPDD